jgi:transcriptional regulator with XRE-family HTH domain
MALVIAKPMDKAIQISGRKLAALRKRRYMTQEELSRALAISKGRVTAIEAEADTAMYLKNFRKLAEVLKIAPDELEKALAPGDVETVSVELPKEVYDSIAARAEHEGHATVAAFLAKVATTKTLRIIAPAEAESVAKRASRKIRAK